jgi:hypothetical protein
MNIVVIVVIVMHSGLAYMAVSVEAGVTMVVAPLVSHEQIFIFVYFVTL